MNEPKISFARLFKITYYSKVLVDVPEIDRNKWCHPLLYYSKVLILCLLQQFHWKFDKANIDSLFTDKHVWLPSSLYTSLFKKYKYY